MPYFNLKHTGLEVNVIGLQINKPLLGKTGSKIVNATHVHKQVCKLFHSTFKSEHKLTFQFVVSYLYARSNRIFKQQKARNVKQNSKRQTFNIANSFNYIMSQMQICCIIFLNSQAFRCSLQYNKQHHMYFIHYITYLQLM